MKRRRIGIGLGLIALVLVAGVLALQVLSHHSVTTTPSATPRPTKTVSRFPLTSANIRNKTGINPQPAMRPAVYYGPNPDGWWCNQPNCARRGSPLTLIDHELKLIAGLGIGVLRLEFDWPLIETKLHHYNWTRADFIVLTAVKYRIQLQPVLTYTPDWAGPSPTASPTKRSWWRQFVSNIVKRYRNSVHYWELWNEPDGGGYWTDGAQKYVQNILLPGYGAVKAADPSAKVLLGAPYYPDIAFLTDIYTYGGGDAFDIAGFHEYSNVLSQNGIQGDVNTVRDILKQKGQADKPIWIGEYGYSETSDTTVDSAHVNALKIMLQQVTGYQEAIWYNLRDDYAMSCCPPSAVKAAYWGLVQHDDTSLKDGYMTLQALNHPGGASK